MASSQITSKINPSSSAAATTSVSTKLRQSCDRCYGQKLRCMREGGDPKLPCERCQRLEAECVYSLSRQKGRPSIRRTYSSQPSTSRAPVQSTPRAAVTTASSSNTTVKANANAKKPRRDSEAEKSDPSPSIDSLGMTSPHDDIYMPIGDLDEVLDLWAFTENDVLDTSFDLSSTSDLTPEIQITDWLVPTKRKSNHLDESSDTIGGETIVPLLSSSASGSDPGIEDVFTSLLRSNTLIATTKIADQRAAEAISHLSQLNVHLYTLHHACGGLQNPGPDFVASQTNNGECLELVAYWLLGMDLKTLDSKIDQPNPANNVTVGRVLHQTFATSHKLLSLLQNFDASLANHLLSATIQDMVLLSHTLLLGIFAKTLAIVEQHVETGNFSSPIAEVRVVSVVQLCPYIIERQTEAVNLHVSRNLPDSTNAPDGSTAHLANLQGLQMAANEKISEILARLRTCLRI